MPVNITLPFHTGFNYGGWLARDDYDPDHDPCVVYKPFKFVHYRYVPVANITTGTVHLGYNADYSDYAYPACGSGDDTSRQRKLSRFHIVDAPLPTCKRCLAMWETKLLQRENFFLHLTLLLGDITADETAWVEQELERIQECLK